MNKLLVSALVSIDLAATAASLTMAQTPNPSATAGAQTHHGMRHDQAPRAFTLPGERVEARLAYIKTALKITDAQLPQWNAFADSLRKQAAERDQRIKKWRAQAGQRTERQQPTAISRLERRQQFHAAAVVSLNERLAVQRPLYAALSADQNQVADEVLAPRGRHGRSHHRGSYRGA